MARVLDDWGAFAVTVFGRGQHLLFFVFSNQHRDDALVFFEHHAAHAAGVTAHAAHVVFVETNRFAAVRKQHHVVLAIGERRANQVVTVVEVDCDDAGFLRTAEVFKRRLLHGAHAGTHKDELVRVEVFGRHDRRNLLAILQREQIDDRLAARIAAAFRHLVNLEPINATSIREAEDVIVRVGDEEFFNEIFFFGRRGLLAATAALLRAILFNGLRFEVAAMGQRDHHVLRLDEIFHGSLFRVEHDFRLALVAKVLLDLSQFVLDDDRDAFGLGQNVEQVLHCGDHFFVLGNNLVRLHRREALQAHFENGFGLNIGETVRLLFFLPAEIGRNAIGAQEFNVRAGNHLFNEIGFPQLGRQRGLRFVRRGRRFDQFNDRIDVCERNGEAFQDMRTGTRLAQFELGAARNDFATVQNELLQEVFQIEQTRTHVHQRNHVHAEAVLQLRVLIEVVQDDVRNFATLQFDNDAHARLVGLVAQVRNAFEALVTDQFADFLQQRRLIDLIRNLINDDGLAIALTNRLKVCASAHDHAAAAGSVAVDYAFKTVDVAASWEIRRGNQLDQLVDRDFGFQQQRLYAVNHLA